jgi:hypothetical protein
MIDYQRIESSQDERLKLKFGKQVPTIHSIQGELENDFYSETEKILEDLHLKAFLKFGRFGLDGTSMTIFIGGHYRESSFSWEGLAHRMDRPSTDPSRLNKESGDRQKELNRKLDRSQLV